MHLAHRTPAERQRLALWVAAVAGPWAWFAIRDAWVGLEAAAIVLPAAYGGAAVAAGAVAVARRKPAVALVVVSLVACALAVTIGPWRPQGGGRPAVGTSVTVAVANVLRNERPYDPITDSIVARGADVNVLVESHEAIEVRMRRAYEFTALGGRRRGDVSVFSRYPLTGRTRLPGALERYGIRVVVEVPSGPFVLYALHLPRPGLTDGDLQVPLPTQRALVEALTAAARAEALPVVLAGDLNLPDRTEGYRILDAAFRDAVRAHSWAGPTSRRALVGRLALRIDHIFVSSSWCAQGLGRFTIPGSDHYGVGSRVGPCQ